MSPYFTCEQGTLYHGDCLEVMKHLPEGSIDLVLTDPPYGTTQCKWDSVLPFEPMWVRLHTLIKKNRAVVLFGSEPFSSALRMSNIKNYKYDWVWEKPHTGQLNAKKRPMRKLESISVFSLDNCVYYPQGLVYNPRKKSRNSTTQGSACYGKHTSAYTAEYSGYPTERIEVKNEWGMHPTQKPVALMEYLTKTYTLEGETVLDFTIGSGTTAVACVNTNRKFIGIEQDEKYIEIAKKRVTDAILAKTEDLENL